MKLLISKKLPGMTFIQIAKDVKEKTGHAMMSLDPS